MIFNKLINNNNIKIYNPLIFAPVVFYSTSTLEYSKKVNEKYEYSWRVLYLLFHFFIFFFLSMLFFFYDIVFDVFHSYINIKDYMDYYYFLIKSSFFFTFLIFYFESMAHHFKPLHIITYLSYIILYGITLFFYIDIFLSISDNLPCTNNVSQMIAFPIFINYDIFITINKYTLFMLVANFIFFSLATFIFIAYFYRLKKDYFDFHDLIIILFFLNFFFIILIISQNLFINYILLIILEVVVFFSLTKKIFTLHLSDNNVFNKKFLFFILIVSNLFIFISLIFFLYFFYLDHNTIQMSQHLLFLSNFLEDFKIVIEVFNTKIILKLNLINFMYIVIYIGTFLKFVYILLNFMRFFNFLKNPYIIIIYTYILIYFILLANFFFFNIDQVFLYYIDITGFNLLNKIGFDIFNLSEIFTIILIIVLSISFFLIFKKNK